MKTIKFNRVHKNAKVEGIKPKIKAQNLESILNSDAFDRDKSNFFNKGGMTYVTFNEPLDKDDDIDVNVKSKQPVDLELRQRWFSMASQRDIDNANEIRDEYGWE